VRYARFDSYNHLSRRKASMTTTIVIDVAKTVFELAAADERGRSSIDAA
jgi:hypothetical protein